MTRTHLIAVATLALALSPLANAGVSNTSKHAIVAADAAGGLPSVTVNLNTRYQDYTGMVPTVVADPEQPNWSPASAHDYTGVAPAPTAALLASVPVWNASMAHDYVTE